MPSRNKLIISLTLLRCLCCCLAFLRLSSVLRVGMRPDKLNMSPHWLVTSGLTVLDYGNPWPDYSGLTVDCPQFIATEPSAVSSSHH